MMEIINRKPGTFALDKLTQEQFSSLFKRKTPDEIELEKRKLAIAEDFLKSFNPEKDVIVSKSQLDIINQITDISKKVSDVHVRLTNDLAKKEKPLTKKQRVELELEQKIEAAHLRVRANGYQR